LVQIVDAALAEAARRSGSWLVCRPGCTQCCHGPFEISQLDAHRLRKGLAPIICRCFGPPGLCDDSGSVAVCELCFDGASDEEISNCVVDFDPGGLEPVLIEALERATGVRGMTTVALSLVS
jgi:hypothetical protein